MYRYFIKPFFDFLFALILIILISPIFLIVSLVLFVINNGKVFFFQKRPGKNEIVFNLIKFKSMTDKKDNHGNLLPDMERVTLFGKFIRNTSLDELPQLINVLKGDMSFIGPRPLLVSYLHLYNTEQKRRHDVKPGITGWAQLNGRNSISWSKKFEYDIYYVDNLSFILDFTIFIRTIKKVMFREGVNANNKVTMESFNGDEIN